MPARQSKRRTQASKTAKPPKAAGPQLMGSIYTEEDVRIAQAVFNAVGDTYMPVAPMADARGF
ncbi:MAG: hypothetical protein HUK26_07775, partial [Duodenibacillus sp.]|nr:hypothetical protein [Duodenibacillus sp.]